MWPPLGTSPGSHRATGSPNPSVCSAASWSTSVAANVLVMLPTL